MPHHATIKDPEAPIGDCPACEGSGSEGPDYWGEDSGCYFCGGQGFVTAERFIRLSQRVVDLEDDNMLLRAQLADALAGPLVQIT